MRIYVGADSPACNARAAAITVDGAPVRQRPLAGGLDR
jgi:hypothetical protein